MTPLPYRPDDGRPFGAATMEEKAAIRARLIAEGVAEPALSFAVEREFEAAHHGQETFAQWQKRVWFPRNAARAAAQGAAVAFTPEELAFLAYHFDGANDPVALAILAKVEKARRA